jgi:hypothetical protein
LFRANPNRKLTIWRGSAIRDKHSNSIDRRLGEGGRHRNDRLSGLTGAKNEIIRRRSCRVPIMVYGESVLSTGNDWLILRNRPQSRERMGNSTRNKTLGCRFCRIVGYRLTPRKNSLFSNRRLPYSLKWLLRIGRIEIGRWECALARIR